MNSPENPPTPPNLFGASDPNPQSVRTVSTPGWPTLTSRISLHKFCSVADKFCSIKRRLASETGFGGLLELKITQKTNLRFSASLMQRVDPDTSTILLDDRSSFTLTDDDVYQAFGLPQGLLAIPSGTTDISDACIEFTRLAFSISSKGIHSLKAAEEIIMKPIDENSTKLDKDCFKIGYVVFSVGHVLNPSTKHYYTSVDYWPALAVPAELNTFNWCRYVRDNLMKGVRKIKNDFANRTNTIQIIGCHLLLQVVVLDKIEASRRILEQNIYPRIKVFDNETLKKTVGIVSEQCTPGTDLLPPPQATEALGLLIKDHNARLMAHFVQLRHSTQAEMASFVDKLVDCVSESCHCCKFFSQKDCVLKSSSMQGNGGMRLDNTAQAADADSKGTESGLNAHSRKRVYAQTSEHNLTSMPPTHTGSPPLTSQGNSPAINLERSLDEANINKIVERLNTFNDNLVASVLSRYSALHLLYPGVAGFAQCTDVPANRVYPTFDRQTCFPDPNFPPNYTPPAIVQFIELWLTNAKESLVESTWFKHKSPRLLSLPGNVIRTEVLGRSPLSYECCTLITRRIAQEDLSIADANNTPLWRKFMEPDFSTLVLQNIDQHESHQYSTN